MKTRWNLFIGGVLLLCLLTGCAPAGGNAGTTTSGAGAETTPLYTDPADVPLDTSDYPDLFPEGVKLPEGSPLLRLRRAVYFIDENEGWVAVPYLFAAGKRDSYIFHTADRGENWEILHDTADFQESTLSAHIGCEPDGLFFRDRENGILVGNSWDYFDVAAFVTADGGRTWADLIGREPGAENWENSLTLLPLAEFGNDFTKMGAAMEDVFITPIGKTSALVSYVWKAEDGHVYENRAVWDENGLQKAERVDLGLAD